MAQRKGLFGVDWGAVGEIAAGVVMGEPERVANALASEAPTEPAPPLVVHDPAHPDRGCGARDGDTHCIGLTPDGVCIMAKDR